KVALRSCTCKVARILAGPTARVSGELRSPASLARGRPGRSGRGSGAPMLPSAMLRKRAVGAAGIGLIGLVAVLAGGAADLLPERMTEVSRQVEEVRGRKFQRSVPASELSPEELKKILRSKINDGIPAPADDYIASLVALGLVDASPGLLDRLVDFYAS